MSKKVISIILIVNLLMGFSFFQVFAEGEKFDFTGVSNSHNEIQLNSAIQSDPQMKEIIYEITDGSVSASWKGPDADGKMIQKYNFSGSWTQIKRNVDVGDNISISAEGSSIGSTLHTTAGKIMITLAKGDGTEEGWATISVESVEFQSSKKTVIANFIAPNSNTFRITVQYSFGNKIIVGKNYDFSLVNKSSDNENVATTTDEPDSNETPQNDDSPKSTEQNDNVSEETQDVPEEGTSSSDFITEGENNEIDINDFNNSGEKKIVLIVIIILILVLLGLIAGVIIKKKLKKKKLDKDKNEIEK